MHKLLARQIRKYLPDKWAEQDGVAEFLESISKSYANNDAKLLFLQRSTIINSKELSEANEILKERAESQKKIIESLERSIASLDANSGKKTDVKPTDEATFDPLALAKKLEDQSSEINRISAEKDLLLKNLEERNQALKNYAHMVSHDLKSPMRNINFLMNWIKEDEIDKFSEQTMRNCQLIGENLEKMDSLVDGILEHATVTDIEEKNIIVDFKELIAELTNTINVPENIEIRCIEPLPTMVLGKYRLKLLFKNILINAIAAIENKENGLIKVASKENSDYWQFSIADNGKGIAKKHQKDIFQMFKKLDDDFSATGIGLALVKKIVSSLNGEIWLESEEGKGATFYFTIKK